MFIGLDIGTSGSKAALVAEDGTILRFEQENYDFCDIKDGKRELNPQTVWDAVTKVLKSVSDTRALSITVSSLGEAIIPVSRTGVTLGNSITGTDLRGCDELLEIEDKVSRERLIQITGQNPSIIYSANKILWIKKHLPDLYKQTWKFMTFEDFIVFRLSGVAKIDYSMASRTMLFNLKRGEWSDYILNRCEIEKDKLSDAVPSGTVAEQIKPEVADSLGLSHQLRIISGAHDHICNAIGCGVINEGDCSNAVGTTEGLTALLSADSVKEENAGIHNFSYEKFAVPNLYNTVAWNNTSGVLLKWFVEKVMYKDAGVSTKEVFNNMNTSMNPNPTDLLVLPHFSGAATPFMDADSKGVILGLNLSTTYADIYKALMEGTNYELRTILDCLSKSGIKITHLVANGGACSQQLLQIKADVLGMKIFTTSERQSGVLGAAILGSLSMSSNSINEAVKAMVKPGIIYIPDTSRMKFYKDRYDAYLQLYKITSPINHQL